MSHKKGFGTHIMLDLNQCDIDKLDSMSGCFDLLDKLPENIGMTKITQPYVFPYIGKVPEDKGITGMVIIAESHISIHTFPIKKYAFIDIFSCKPFNTDLAIEYCITKFKSERPEVHKVNRGREFPQGAVIVNESSALKEEIVPN